MIDVQQFRVEVVRPTLQFLGLWSLEAERLMMGTAAVESGFKYIRQVGGGPALGFFQVEPATRHDIHANFLAYRPAIRDKVTALLMEADGMTLDRQLIVNLAYSTAIARLVYYRRPQRIPEVDDERGLARYWKAHYNTIHGAGTVDKFLDRMKFFSL
jgi:hypothetical protein